MMLKITWQKRAGDAEPYSGEDFLQGFASKRHPRCSGAAWSLHWEELSSETNLVAFNLDAPGWVGDMSHKQHGTMLFICEMLSQHWGSTRWKLNMDIMFNSPYPWLCASLSNGRISKPADSSGDISGYSSTNVAPISLAGSGTLCFVGNGCNIIICILRHHPCLSLATQWIKVSRGLSVWPCCYRTVTGVEHSS